MNLKDKTKLVVVFLVLGLVSQFYFLAVNTGLISFDNKVSNVLFFINLGGDISLIIFFLAIIKKQKE